MDANSEETTADNMYNRVQDVGSGYAQLEKIPLSTLQKLYNCEELRDRIHGNNEITYLANYKYLPVKLLKLAEKKRILVTGGAGFVGSHLIDRLLLMGHDVVCIDNFFTGSKSNVSHWIGHPNFELVRHDIVDPFMIEVDQIYHLACPASPRHYQTNAVKTLKTSFVGTLNALGLAKRTKAKILIASTSEVYGDPITHPQPEDYWGNVSCTGPRACYDEGKRVAESLAYGYSRQDKVDVRVARVFNTFGPRMNPYDGRVTSNFILQALKNQPMTVYGDGNASRSFMYIHDLIDGLILLMNSDYSQGPINLGNPHEMTILEFGKLIADVVGSDPENIVYQSPVEDDPTRRMPDITRAKTFLEWKPQWTVQQGLEETVEYFKALIRQGIVE